MDNNILIKYKETLSQMFNLLNVKNVSASPLTSGKSLVMYIDFRGNGLRYGMYEGELVLWSEYDGSERYPKGDSLLQALSTGSGGAYNFLMKIAKDGGYGLTEKEALEDILYGISIKSTEDIGVIYDSNCQFFNEVGYSLDDLNAIQGFECMLRELKEEKGLVYSFVLMPDGSVNSAYNYLNNIMSYVKECRQL